MVAPPHPSPPPVARSLLSLTSNPSHSSLDQRLRSTNTPLWGILLKRPPHFLIWNLRSLAQIQFWITILIYLNLKMFSIYLQDCHCSKMLIKSSFSSVSTRSTCVSFVIS
jgi:hypothetical protein